MAFTSLSLPAPAAPVCISRKKSDLAAPALSKPQASCRRASRPTARTYLSPSSGALHRSSRRRSTSVTGPMLPTLSAALPRLAWRSLFFAATVAATAVFAGVGAGAAFSSDGAGEQPAGPKNVFGQELAPCSTDPLTGYYRDGRCDTGPYDFGTHTVCAQVTQKFLEYTLGQGNDLITPRPEYRFPGLKEGDGWCLCASRWREAMLAGVAPPVMLEATHEKTLEYVQMGALQQHAVGGGASTE